MLDNVPANAITQSVEFSDNTLAKNFNLNNNNIESGQDYAVIPLFDDAHKVLGRDRYEQINTVSDYAGIPNLRISVSPLPSIIRQYQQMLLMSTI